MMKKIYIYDQEATRNNEPDKFKGKLTSTLLNSRTLA